MEGSDVLKRGYIFSILAAVMFGCAGIFVKLAFKSGLDSVNLLSAQYIIAVIVMFTAAFIKNRASLIVSHRQLFDLAMLGIVGNTFMTIFYYEAFSYLPVAIVTLLLYTYPIMIFIYTCIFKKSKLKLKKIAAVFIAFTGCLLTLNVNSGKFSFSFIGISFGILSAIFYSFMNLYTESHLSQVNSLAINAYSTLFSLLALMIYRFPTFLFKKGITSENLKYIVLLAILCEIIPLTLLYEAIKYIGALKVSIISNLEIPTAMIISFCILNEKVMPTQIGGAMLIVYAVYLVKENNKIQY
jgi:drug/metabolite transporter (DMT)-like permease